MRILIVGKELDTPAMREAVRRAGVEAIFMGSRSARACRNIAGYPPVSALILGADHGDHTSLAGSLLLQAAELIVPVSGENMAAGISTLPQELTRRLSLYFAYSGQENLYHGLCLIRDLAEYRDPGEVPPPKPMPLDAIYTFDGRFYSTLADYLAANPESGRPLIGILSYRSRWADGDLALEASLVRHLEKLGIGAVPAFSEGSADPSVGALKFEEVLDRFFCLDGKCAVDGLINFQFFGAKAGEGKSMFAVAAEQFKKLDVPVFHPPTLSGKTEEEWRRDPHPYRAELSTHFIIPELQGMIESVHIACADSQRQRKPVESRVERLCARIRKWVDLRHKENREKRVALFLHNAPCSGVEATLGQATDLDGFESTVQILRALQAQGYTVREIPKTGEELQAIIRDRRAHSDFRWTAAEDIAASGGVLAAVGLEEYLPWYRILPEDARGRVEEVWGPPPGEAMVLEGKLLVTGVSFGNVLVMVQPKRGCYGAKCTGEVCKILQDPTCPPPHQYLATYWYLQNQWHADAVIHLGTHGSLEYLPGKECGLSESCFPDAAIGVLPNLYPYQASIMGQAMMAKRRSYAVTLSYLPSPGRGLDEAQRRLLRTLRQYFAALEQGGEQAETIRGELEALCRKSEAAQNVLKRAENFEAAMGELRTMLTTVNRTRRGKLLRSFGSIPEAAWREEYLCEMLQSELGEDWERQEDELRLLIRGVQKGAGDLSHPLAERIAQTENLLKHCNAEMESLLHGLAGGYIAPTPPGEAAMAGMEILPTGRNLYSMQPDTVPTPSAYERGARAAEDLLAAYRSETGTLPMKLALNMTSMDVTRTGGEQIGQFLALLGVRPVWSPDGRVEGLRPIPLPELGRPRVDAVVRISSVMRDAWPDAIALMDRAVELAAGLPEADGENYIRCNNSAMARETSECRGRIFGGRPGTYTSAVGLALKASAWNSEEDLARYFIDASSYVYGEGRYGVRSVESFAANARQIDATSDITCAGKTDGVSSSYSSRVQGGFRLAAKALGSRKEIRQYVGESGRGGKIRVTTLAEHLAHNIQETLLNDVWREQMMTWGSQGGAALMEQMQNLFDAQCVNRNIPDAVLDELTRRYMLDERMQKWLLEHSPHALEEMERRFLELSSRGRWEGDPKVLKGLRRRYLQAEGALEDGLSGEHDLQGGAVTIVTAREIQGWETRLKETDDVIGLPGREE